MDETGVSGEGIPSSYLVSNMQIVLERPMDATAIRQVTEAAFKGVPYSKGTEGKIVDALREAGALTLSLIAIQGAEIFGHVAFSPVRINGGAGNWYGLGPVSVRPDRQGKGIGQLLVRDGLQRLSAMSADGCVVLGHPSYYGRFGFENDPGLLYADAPPGYFQRLVLCGKAPLGDVTYHPGFDAT